MHHAGHEGAQAFFGALDAAQVPYDLAALSYYPWWHGPSLERLFSSVAAIHDSTGRDVVIIETAAPFTLGWNDLTNNVLGTADGLATEHPPTPAGQAAFLRDLVDGLQATRGGAGVVWWEPTWTAFRGPQATDGSAWENLALFDFDGRALPALDVSPR